MEFISQQALLYPDLAAKYEVLLELFNRKLWHQLTVELNIFLSTETNKRDDNFPELYEHFISKFEAKLNQVKLAQLLTTIAKSLADASQGCEFLERALSNRTRLGPEASLCIELDTLMFKLQIGLLDETKNGLEAAKQVLDGISSSESVVFSKFYLASAEYHKAAGPPEKFYGNALMYLSYTSLEELSPASRYSLATDMSLAAITSDDVYNFGEVIATPVLDYLDGTPNQWLKEMIVAFNQGDIDQFNLLVDAHKQEYFEQVALASRHDFVKQKVVMLTLMNMVFEKPAHERNIAFSEIAVRTKLSLDQVEWLVMRAMSLNLIKGTMDQVLQTLHVTWVQPRVLDNSQLQQLRKRLDDWTTKVKEARAHIEEQTPELFV